MTTPQHTLWSINNWGIHNYFHGWERKFEIYQENTDILLSLYWVSVWYLHYILLYEQSFSLEFSCFWTNLLLDTNRTHYTSISFSPVNYQAVYINGGYIILVFMFPFGASEKNSWRFSWVMINQVSFPASIRLNERDTNALLQREGETVMVLSTIVFMKSSLLNVTGRYKLPLLMLIYWESKYFEFKFFHVFHKSSVIYQMTTVWLIEIPILS